MRVAFIDDSSQSNPPRDGLGNLISLGAAIFPEGSLAPFAEDLAVLKEQFSIPHDEEIKWKPAKGSFLAQAGGESVVEFRQAFLQLAKQHDVRTVVVIIDRSVRYCGRDAVELGQVLLKWIFERISMFLDDAKEAGIIVADKPGGGSAEEGHWLSATLSLTNGGTEYVEPGKIVIPILTADSAHVPHLQLADMVVASTTAAVAGRRSGLSLKQELRGLAHRHSLGAVNGAGLVLYPDQPNLYYWVLGEEMWAKASAQSGWSLPTEQFAYFTTDGLSS